MACRRAEGVSPLRTITRTGGSARPSAAAAAESSASGCARFFSMSFPSAFSGET